MTLHSYVKEKSFFSVRSHLLQLFFFLVQEFILFTSTTLFLSCPVLHMFLIRGLRDSSHSRPSLVTIILHCVFGLEIPICSFPFFVFLRNNSFSSGCKFLSTLFYFTDPLWNSSNQTYLSPLNPEEFLAIVTFTHLLRFGVW